jgi:membrane protease YdiL (CAAX protease family)
MQEIKRLWGQADKNAVKGILFITLIVTVYCYFGTQAFFVKAFGDNGGYWKYIYHNFMPLPLFFAGGLLFVKFGLKGRLRDYGLSAGEAKLGLKLCLVGVPICVLAGLTAAFDKDMAATYPLARGLFDMPFQYILLYYLSYIAYYVGWEFLFRGVGIFSTQKSGVFLSVAITTMVSALIHTSIASFGKPFAETFSAIPAGIVFGYVAYKTKSMYYTLLLHILVGFCTDFLITLLA